MYVLVRIILNYMYTNNSSCGISYIYYYYYYKYNHVSTIVEQIKIGDFLILVQ